ncbi:unnamed protein product [Dibothriocephalus latus]|uniref:Uncharacterized protein n=1 Tax=Dibothriocephalus latus TaxID=60516 RepID=A0A3P6UN29_DIBLA|nr:unnamed protein product [Dibothriocephalus latus]
MFHTQPTGFYGQLVTQPPPPPHPIAGVFAVNEVSYAFGQQQSAALPPIQSLPVTEAAAVTVKPDGSLPEAETCCRCRGLATTEEPFLVCKECGIQVPTTSGISCSESTIVSGPDVEDYGFSINSKIRTDSLSILVSTSPYDPSKRSIYPTQLFLLLLCNPRKKFTVHNLFKIG